MNTKGKPGPKPDTYARRNEAILATVKAMGKQEAAHRWGLGIWSINNIIRQAKAAEAEG